MSDFYKHELLIYLNVISPWNKGEPPSLLFRSYRGGGQGKLNAMGKVLFFQNFKFTLKSSNVQQET